MEVLMPSEIARLVFGYLKDEGCDTVAQLFLETSPRLEECRAVVARGKSFNTKISDMSLVDILEKYCMATTIVHEKLNRIADNDFIKRTNDLVDQLKYLLEGSRSQRFVVNINVPPQSNNQTGESPIISGSLRKRRHSNTERDRHKKARVIQLERTVEQVPNLSCDNTEATPLESLPGHSSSKDESSKSHSVHKEAQKSNQSAHNDEGLNSLSTKTKSVDSAKEADQDNKSSVTLETETTKKCTMATNTEELLTYANTEVQTMPCDINEPSESEWNDEPIENLSLLTKELLVRTELQERIAAKINKVIYQESGVKDESHCETQGAEANISLMTELDNAIKTTVAATENDPVFEQFLSEMIGNSEEPDTSPDEDSDVNKKLPEKEQNSKSAQPDDVESALHDQNAAAVMSIINANITNQMAAGNNDVETVPEKPLETLAEKPLETLAEKLNISIPDMDDSGTDNAFEAANEGDVCAKKEQSENVKPVVTKNDGNVSKSSETKPMRKGRRPRIMKPKESNSNANNTESSTSVVTSVESSFMAMQALPTVPTLVYTTKEENSRVFSNYSTNRPKPCRSGSGYIPILPKGPEHQEPALYLKTVNVPIKCLPVATPQDIVKPNPAPNPVAPATAAPKEPKEREVRKRRTSRLRKDSKVEPPSTIQEEPLAEEAAASQEVVVVEKPKEVSSNAPAPESLTLYGAENSRGTCVDTENMPILNLDSFCMSTSGFSPLLKFVDKKIESVAEGETKPKEFEKLIENPNDKSEQESAALNYDLITKRTPMSLRKSQMRNKRLSMSTPRRRSHVRALDFDTPKKSFSTTKSGNPVNERRSKSLCRATLFTSPPAEQMAPCSPQKLCHSGKSEATMSPLPKLSSCWEKYTGMGMILGSMSPKDNEISSEKIEPNEQVEKKVEEEKEVEKKDSEIVDKEPEKKELEKKAKCRKSWDADLRASLSLDTNKQLEIFEKHFPKAKKGSSTDEKKEEKEEKSEDNKTEDKVTTENSKVDLTASSVDASLAMVNSTKAQDKKVKKYAKLKTITTTVTKVVSGSIDVSPILDTKVVTAIKTPRKLEDNMLVDIPPTPRLHTPGNSTLSNYLKISDDSMKIRNFIATPEIPATPCVVFTPHPSDRTLDGGKTDGANYYHPEETKETTKELKALESRAKEENPVCMSEIIQFEVIKENLPKEEAEKELKIATSVKDLSMSSDGDANYVSTTTIVKETLHISHCHNSTASDSESSDSDSSSSSSNSSYSSNSDTSCTTNPPDSARKKSKTPLKSNTESLAETTCESVKEVPKVSVESKDDSKHQDIVFYENEASPAKVFPVFSKNVEEESIKETPAKDETEEAVISETPSSSKTGVEMTTTTNLASKISAMMDSSKPKILSIKNVSLPVDPRLIPNISRLDSRSTFSTLSPNKKKLQLQLEQKKERLKKALKNTKPSVKLEKTKLHSLMSLKNNKQKELAPKRVEKVTEGDVEGDKKIDRESVVKAAVVTSNEKMNVIENFDPEKSEEKKKKKQLQTAAKLKSVQKQKVDQIKRDLFSDEESSDKRTTRSISRRIMDAQRASNPEEAAIVAPSAEDAQVPGVLECLQLVPANKNDQDIDEQDVLNTSQNGVQAYIRIIYDESTGVKRRKRRCSSSDMEIRLTDEDGRDYCLRSTEYQELFDCAPKPKKRAPQKRTASSTAPVKRQRKPPAKLGVCDDIMLTDVLPKPLATSSPAFKGLIGKKTEEEQVPSDEPLLLNNIKDKPKRKRNPKTEEDDKVKKPHFGNPYSEDMLNGVDLENFLDQVHGT